MKPLVLITGVSGRIGMHAAKQLSPKYKVIGLDLIPMPESIPDVDFMKIDLSSDESVQTALDHIKQRYGREIASILHLAAYYNFSGGGWDKYEAITIGGTRRMLAYTNDCKVEQFIFTSTMLVYAPCQLGQKIDENWPVDPKWEYPRSKVITENLLKEKHGDSSLLILRIAGVYDDYCHSIPISNQIQRIYEKQLESHFYPGNLAHGNAFIHMDDLVSLCLLAIDKRKELPKEEILLAGEETTLSYLELQHTIGRLLYAKPWATYRIPKWVAKIGASIIKNSFIKPWMIDLADDHYALDVTRARHLLGWQLRHSLRESLPLMIAALKKDPAGWYRVHGLKK